MGWKKLAGIGLLVWGLALAPTQAADEPKTDAVRVLIDVSGSMKETDPNNLRKPALRLLVNLLPGNSRAGVWSFAQYVNRMTDVGPVDGQWRDQASGAVDQIHSRGLFTDIGGALAQATHDWQERDPDTRRSLILLTDGKVDVSKEPGANQEARQALLDNLLPRIRDGGTQIYTIALSDNADKALLQALATETDGEFYLTRSADELQKIFLRLFEQTVDQETVPMEGNRFQVDGQIKEMTVLAFREQDAEPTRLQPPEGQAFGRENTPANVRWHQDRGYDLITVEDPLPGEWTLIADVDPDNRVMIVTDLKLQTTTLPNNLIQGETVLFAAQLTEKGETITRPDFLEVVDLSVARAPVEGDGPGARWSLDDNGMAPDQRAGDGVYTVNIGEALPEGRHEVVTTATSPTFERRDRQRVNVVGSPLQIEQVVGPEGAKTLRMRSVLDWLDAGQMRIAATVSTAQGDSRQATLQGDAEGVYTLPLPETGMGQSVTVELALAARTTSGRDVNVTLDPMIVEPVQSRQPAPEKPTEESQPNQKAPADDGPNWMFIIAILVAANAVVFGLLAIGYLLMRQRKQKKAAAADNGDDDAEEKGEP